MALRLTGLMSGIDTESVIQELVAARQNKVDEAKKAQTKLSWKQDAWSSLNTKLKNLQSKYLSTMRFADAYSKRTTSVSNGSYVSVITGANAVNGVQSLQINQLAKTGYLTGAKISGTSGSKLTALSKVGEIAGGLSAGESGVISVTAGGKNVDIAINSDTTISDILTQMQDAGLNASFDAKQQRFFVSSKESGASNDFTITGADPNGEKALSALGMGSAATKIMGQDAEINLNGAIFTSSTNVFEINGLTFTALSETNGETITVTTQDDTEGIYDMIKDFLTEYNSVINEMDKLYNAESAKGYEPLTDEEKDAMSESEIEDWEKKIKDALLRRDENVSSIGSALKSIMSAGVVVNGKTMYLSDFGINTLGYFEAADNEKNAYHIDGDEDDEFTSANADKLKGMISNDPDTVISFFTQLSKDLYTKMTELSSSVDGYRSYGSFYDDKKMKEDHSDYTAKIAELEEKLADYEDKWYAKFAAMETALAKLQSSASAVTGLLGGS